ncbi:hypothetical protein WA026_009398 [Henosepilachna vigintioctopunctata]|uniref:Hermansky-Pudlak syndrome 5 protein homolog n=1 Tax=Henosepilachna vigintioctopunctata TaxID=420089 RepID=A0AAW1U3U0_9CUCU
MFSSYGMKKFEKLFAVEHTDPINHILEETFKLSQRIKLICFDISCNYIVFGANNGSVHVYKRTPEATFSKLIPCKIPAAIQQISISPKEGNVSIVDETGTILILENCFIESNFYTHVYSECKGKRITTTKWDTDSRIYIGDDDGEVAILTVPNLRSMALLNTPYVALMDLGAPIIQIDTFSRFILVTTKRKTFICDTEREMYKQVGRKEKSLGACFSQSISEELAQSNEDLVKYRLYCARPGLRMWVANFEGEVFYTHKYRNVVPNISEILKFCGDETADLVTENVSEDENKSFGKMLVFNDKYLCVANRENLHIIDSEKNDLVFYKRHSDLVDIKLINDEIFMWNLNSTSLKVLNFFTIEEILSRILKYRQYKAGAQFVLKYKCDVIEWSKFSQHVKLLNELGCKLSTIDNELSQKFQEILQEVMDYEEKQLLEYLKEDDPKIGTLNIPKIVESIKEVCYELQTMEKQYKLNESNHIVIIPQFTEMLINMTGNDMTKLFMDFIKHLEGVQGRVDMDWCYNQYLHHFNLKKYYLKFTELNSQTIEFVTKSFLQVNRNCGAGCPCSFPLPCLNRTPTKYIIIGNALLEYSEKPEYLLHKVPHLWLDKIDKFIKLEDFEKNLPLILQFGCVEILKNVPKYVTFDFCDNLIDLFVKLKSRKCLNCGSNFSEEISNHLMKWDCLGLMLIPFIGADNVLKLFLSRHMHIPQSELTEKFYMTCMFSKIRTNSSENELGSKKAAVKLALELTTDNDTKTEVR